MVFFKIKFFIFIINYLHSDYINPISQSTYYSKQLGKMYNIQFDRQESCFNFMLEYQINETQFTVDPQSIINPSKFVFNSKNINCSQYTEEFSFMIDSTLDSSLDYNIRLEKNFENWNLDYPVLFLQDFTSTWMYIDFGVVVLVAFPCFVVLTCLYMLVLCCKDIKRQQLFKKWVVDGYLMIQNK